MTDTVTTQNGVLVSAHIGPVHLDRTPKGVQVTLVAAVNPTAHLNPEQVRHLSQALALAT